MAKNKNPKVSYVLPVYNEEANIASCIRSILAFKGKTELIVINDGSTDHTAEVLATFGRKIQVVTNHKRKGSAACRNLGNKLATGDVIGVCDVDIYLPERHQATKEFFKSEPEAGVFYAAARCRDARSPKKEWIHPFQGWDFESKCPVSHPTVAYRREAALAHPYHETSKDTDLFEFMLLDMQKAGVVFGGTDTPVMVKLEKQRKRDKEKSNDLKQKMYKKYGIDVADDQFVEI